MLKFAAIGMTSAAVFTASESASAQALALPSAHGANRRKLFVRAGSGPGNSGRTPATAFATLQEAADISLPGDLIYVLNGVYRDSDTPGAAAALRVTRSGAPGAPITYAAFPHHHPEIRASSTSWEGIKVAGAAYIEIDGFTVIGNSETLRYEDAYAARALPTGTYNANGIFVADDIDGARAHHVTVRNNLVRHWPGGGIGTKNVDYVTIENNVVHSNSWFSVYANSGISILVPWNFDDSTGYRNVVTRNIAFDNESYVPWKALGRISDGNGIIIDSTRALERDTGERYVGRTSVTNNISFSNGGSGVHAFDCEFVDIINNTVYNNSRSPALSYAGLYASYCNETNVLNNIVSLRAGEPSNNATNNTAVVYDYNIYFNGLPPVAMGPHDLVADPLLARPSDSGSAGDFTVLRGSPAIDSGTATLAPTVDYTGSRRPRGTGVDRGAFEFSGRRR